MKKLASRIEPTQPVSSYSVQQLVTNNGLAYCRSITPALPRVNPLGPWKHQIVSFLWHLVTTFLRVNSWTRWRTSRFWFLNKSSLHTSLNSIPLVIGGWSSRNSTWPLDPPLSRHVPTQVPGRDTVFIFGFGFCLATGGHLILCSNCLTLGHWLAL